MKHDEFTNAKRLNKEYLKREEEELRMIEKTKSRKHLLMNVVAQWETKKKKKAIFNAIKQRVAGKK